MPSRFFEGKPCTQKKLCAQSTQFRSNTLCSSAHTEKLSVIVKTSKPHNFFLNVNEYSPAQAMSPNLVNWNTDL